MITATFIVSVVISLVFAQGSPPAPPSFDWSTITPTTDLNWVPCYEVPLQCTRLTAPLNYSNPDAGTVALAIIRHPAASAGNSSYKGPLLLNPGGPGGSGVGLIQAGFGRAGASIVGPDYDILSWDPRGVGQTTPKIDLFKNSAERNVFWAGSPSADLDFRTDRVEDQWAWMQVLGQLAQDRDSTGILPHVTTDNVAQDMLTIVNAHGQEKLNFWGLSYGTVLGSVFATLFPDKVGRLILDGVVNVDDAYFNTDRGPEFVDAEKSLSHFLDECHKAGPKLCEFYEESRADMRKKLDQLFSRIAKQPIPAYSPNVTTYGTITSSLLKASVFGALKGPLGGYASIAADLQELENGSGIRLISQNVEPPESVASVDAVVAIPCVDAAPVNDNPKDLRQYSERIDHISRFQSTAATFRLICSGWRIDPANFRGPTGARNTSFPILFIGNTADPVTPVRNAFSMAKRFPGSVALRQDSAGHCSVAVASECTIAAINAYLNQGVLPKDGTVCPFNGTYFRSPAAANATDSGVVQRRTGGNKFSDAAEELRDFVQSNSHILAAF